MARLAAGVRKKENGRYEKRFTVNGKRYSVSGSSSKECVEKELALRKEIEEKGYKKNSNITLDQYYDEWEKRRINSLKPNTTEGNRSTYKNRISPYLGDKKIVSIEKRQVYEMVDKLLKKYKYSTINQTVSLLVAILESAIVDEITDKNVAASIGMLKGNIDTKDAKDTIHRALTQEEQKLFLEYCKDEWLYEFFYFSLCTGMRIGEIAALKWSDIDYKNNVIHITKTVQRDNQVTLPKSKTSIRDIPLTKTIKQILKSQKEKMFLYYGGNVVKSDRIIFVVTEKSPVRSNVISRAIKRVLDKIEKDEKTHIEPFTHHAFRDTFATRFIEGGGTMQTLKTILGHSSYQMTADLYAHVLPNTKQDEMNLVEEMF